MFKAVFTGGNICVKLLIYSGNVLTEYLFQVINLYTVSPTASSSAVTIHQAINNQEH